MGREKLLSIGVYTEVSLKKARASCEIGAEEILNFLRKIEDSGRVETANRLKQLVGPPHKIESLALCFCVEAFLFYLPV